MSRPRVWTTIAALVAGFVAHLASGLFVGIVATFMVVSQLASEGKAADDPIELQRRLDLLVKSSWGLAIMGGLGSTWLGAGALAAGGMSKTPLVARMRLGRSTFDTGSILLSILGLFGVSFAAGGLAEHLGYGESGFLAEMKRAIAAATPAARVALVIGIAFAAGVGEELLFRGYVQTRLVDRFGAAPGIAIASLAFAAFHIDPVHAAIVLPMGVYFGYVAHRAGSIRPTIVAHVLNNAAAVILPAFGPTSAKVPFTVGAFVMAVAATTILEWRLWRRHRDVPSP